MVTLNVPHLATGNPPLAKATRTRRPTNYPRLPPLQAPVVTPVLADGEPAVQVQLSGGKAQGAVMLLTPDTWAWVRENYGACWVLTSGSPDRVYVASTRVGLAYLTRQRGEFPTTLLSRLIAFRGKVERGKRVWFRNGDTLDLRDCNLMVRRGGRGYFHPDQPRAVITPDPG